MSETSSELTPVTSLPHTNGVPMRLTESDSSTCLAWHTFEKDTDRHLFIKQLRPKLATSAEHRNAFIKEFHMGQKLESEYFPHYHQLEDSERGLFITMDFIEGEKLSDMLQSSPHYFQQKENILRLMRQLLEAMDAMHQADIVHLDLKPDNILITHRTNNVRIIDFGYSCSGEWSQTMGRTKAFASPEQIASQKDQLGVTSDIYSFGKIIQEVAERAAYPLPADIHKIIQRCTHEQPEERFASAHEVLLDLEAHIRPRKRVVAKIAAISIALTCMMILLGSLSYKHIEGFVREAMKPDSTVINGMIYVIDPRHTLTCLPATEDVLPYLERIRTIQQMDPNVRKSVSSIFIAEGVDNICPKAFADLENLMEVTCLAREVPAMGDSIFANSPIESSTLYVPAACVERYKATAPWNAFGSIVGITDPFANKKCGNDLTWSYNEKDSTLTISGTGKMQFDPISPDCESAIAPWFGLRTGIKHVVVEEGVRSIAAEAFASRFYAIESVSLPESLDSIGEQAFYACSHLKAIRIPHAVRTIPARAFQGCNELETLELPDSITTLGLRCFEGCKGITHLTLGEMVTDVEKFAFKECSALDSVAFNARNCRTMGIWTSTVFESCPIRHVSIGENVKVIPRWAFYGCGNITEIHFPEGLELIGEASFMYCTQLKTIVIPNSVSFVEYRAFGWCERVESITFSGRMTRIDRESFTCCSALKSITLPPKVKEIKPWAFEGCTSLKAVTIPSSVKVIEERAFNLTNSLDTVINYATTPQQIPDDCFSHFRHLYVPDASVGAYRSDSNWKRFRVHPMSELK